MPYVTTKEMLGEAAKNNYAVCAFNAENLEMVQAIVAGAEELAAPVIIQTTPSTLKYADCTIFYAIAHTAAENSAAPAALHLDHGDSFGVVWSALEAGYSSFMIDASQKSFEENVEITKGAVGFAARHGVPVEAELGRIGGKEDGLDIKGDIYTDPAAAALFVKRTGVASLAVAIGTAHGLYKSAPVLDLDRLSAIKKTAGVPLVLHGATGLSDDTVRACVGRGINKINFATELRAAYTGAVREKLNSGADIIDPKIYGGYARDRVRELVKEKIMLSGSAGRV